jgi:crotonobetainyl-CoA:carnitine CoA-transferase CaiB-like acyl-CoA transferase
VDTNLFDVALHQLAYQGTWYLNGGQAPGRLPRSAHPSLVPVQTYRTADGWIYVMCMKDKFWENLARKIGRGELVSDPRFSTQAARLKNRDELTRVLDGTLSTRTTDEWLDQLRGVAPVAPVYDVERAFANPFVERTGMVRTVPHPAKPDYRALANPIRIDGQRAEQAVCSPLGADNRTYLGKPAPAVPETEVENNAA